MPVVPERPMDGRVLTSWARTAVAGLEARCEEINSLNVFPIPDADTGTNLLFTMRAALEAIDKYAGNDGHQTDVRQVAIALARGAVAGARGNSGSSFPRCCAVSPRQRSPASSTPELSGPDC